MVDTELRLPRKKRRINNSHIESPFPVPIQSITNRSVQNSRWYYYFGQLVDDHVVVSKASDVEFLYRLGFFGKGLLSRSKAQYSKFCAEVKDASASSRKGRKKIATEVQQEKLRIHTEWAKELEKFKSEGIDISESGNDEAVEDTPSQYADLCLSEETVLDDCITEGEDDLCDASPGPTNTRQLEKNPACFNSSILPGVERTENEEAEGFKEADDQNISVEHDQGADVGPPPCKIMRIEDKYEVKEPLILTLEEAFFLSFGLGCLAITDSEGSLMNLLSLWRRFLHLKSNFVDSYAVYHYFRSKGWIVRGGIMYGTDYVLYKDGPEFYHSSYAVVVQSNIAKEEEGFEPNRWTWPYITTLNRVVENVAKELLVCSVIKPQGTPENFLDTPVCLSRLKVQETLFRRWIPEKFREKEKP